MKKYFYCFDKQTNTWIFLEDKGEFLNFVTRGADNDYIIKNTSLSFEKEIKGRYVFCDSDFNILNIEDFEEDIKVHKKMNNNQEYFIYYPYRYTAYYYRRKHQFVNNISYGDILYKRTGHNLIPYAYRKDPVPCLRGYWSYKPERKIKYKQIISTYKNPEKKEFIRPHHYTDLIKGACDYENFYGVCNQKTWKKKKIKHQWEKNIK